MTGGVPQASDVVLPQPARPAIVMPDGEVVDWPGPPPASWSATGWPARFGAAARLATLVHPDPVGELVERELRSGLLCAGRFGAEPVVDEDALLIRVVEHVLGTVERRIATARILSHGGVRTPGAKGTAPSAVVLDPDLA